ncbi:MAG: metallophosphoesterase family protein [Planctomycetes bacterium]|nr:metallophosphoesterase family protein [Planctomycetota bacterium]
MRYAIFGDVHSNIEALDAVLAAIDAENCDEIFCLGDIVGYGANPKECLDRIRNRQIVTVAGNHDLAAVNRFDLTFFNSSAREAMLYTIGQLTPSDLEFLAALPLSKTTANFALVHSSPRKPENFDYIFTIPQAEEAFEDVEADVTFIGHSHVPVIFFQEYGETDDIEASEFYLRRNRKIIFNCGSVGQPRDGDPDACYAIFDTSIAKLKLKRVAYDVDAAARKIIDADLPLILAERLYKGY